MSIKENIEELKKEIPRNVEILAATKTRNIDEIKETISSGIKIIGENYVGEAEEKYEALKGKARIHCIGHLQTNKVKKAVKIFDMIESVDSLKTASEIDLRCKEISKIMPILIEVNSGKEENKDGCMPQDVLMFAKKISELKNIRLEGIMTMGPFISPKKLRPYFRETKKIFDKLKKEYNTIFVLSMGMSDSYPLAIEEGATRVRIGTKIFGKR